MRPIVFLHIPKTAGQTIHHALAAIVGVEHVSPIRVNEQANGGNPLPPGYLLHSGHLDWTELDRLEGNPFVFSVLRDPAERIGSFYFYMLNTAREASPEELSGRRGLERILYSSADEYFFGGNEEWQGFIQNMYFNFYCSYFTTRRMGGRKALKGLKATEVVDRAFLGTAAVERIYTTDSLVALEADIEGLYGHRARLQNHYKNAGDRPVGESRWARLCAHFEKDGNICRLETFLAEDHDLMARLAAAGRLS